MNPTDFIWPALGGALIGLASALLLLFKGRVAGISGIFGLALSSPRDSGWRWAFVLGLVAGGVGYLALSPASFASTYDPGLPLTAAAGLLVGFGTRLGSGCTSGHGVCGLSRLSARSLVATLTFIATGAVTTWVMLNLVLPGA